MDELAATISRTLQTDRAELIGAGLSFLALLFAVWSVYDVVQDYRVARGEPLLHVIARSRLRGSVLRSLMCLYLGFRHSLRLTQPVPDPWDYSYWSALFLLLVFGLTAAVITDMVLSQIDGKRIRELIRRGYGRQRPPPKE